MLIVDHTFWDFHIFLLQITTTILHNTEKIHKLLFMTSWPLDLPRKNFSLAFPPTSLPNYSTLRVPGSFYRVFVCSLLSMWIFSGFVSFLSLSKKHASVFLSFDRNRTGISSAVPRRDSGSTSTLPRIKPLQMMIKQTYLILSPSFITSSGYWLWLAFCSKV